MDKKCTKCGSDDLLIRHQKAGAFITSTGRGKHPSEFVHSSEYDYYWTYTVDKDHLLIHCRCCQYEWRIACEDDVKKQDLSTRKVD